MEIDQQSVVLDVYVGLHVRFWQPSRSSDPRVGTGVGYAPAAVMVGSSKGWTHASQSLSSTRITIIIG
ncbi:uncharacterized protein ColSpa_05634 [Colletotrichum spaethianum]|uniref:Uncharacterized protein n=1 Tax=Colletotrichum spaethianum TaxID=700344 RepID=A0AA37LFD7_9PEZI|nr:uncharacterized protein ColSpa_05634 [Colletotrichum spaethianum]GKT45453.1 hypothetical protein ColSpa_05634 [Colletotrichum spaethianum]